jgi:tetratricopeptide (TPR) repeat protein
MAIEFYNKALDIDAENITSLKKLGKIYYDIYKDHEKALTYFKRVNELDPSDDDVKTYLIECNKN